MGTLKENNSKKYIFLSALVAAGMLPVQTVRAACSQPLVNITVLTTATKLEFATIGACELTGGTERINEINGARSSTGCNNGLLGTVARPRIRIKGNHSAAEKIKVSITNANSVVIATTGAGTKTMAVTAIKMKQGSPTYSFGGHLTKTIDVGGKLNFNANQTGGTYTGTFTLTAVCM